MAALVESGRLIDLILLLLVLEILTLQWLLRRLDGHLRLLDLLPNLLAGAFLLMSVRVALSGGDWRILVAALSLALLAHICDLYQRLRRSER